MPCVRHFPGASGGTFAQIRRRGEPVFGPPGRVPPPPAARPGEFRGICRGNLPSGTHPGARVSEPDIREMPSPPDTADLPLDVSGSESTPAGPDPDLVALPEPRRPGRRLTLGTLAITIVVSLVMAFALRSEAGYALEGGTPGQLGNLAELEPRPNLANTWVQGEALLSSSRAVRYSRPLEADSYRLAPVAGNPRLWVQVRVPSGLEGPRFVPPTSFVGRLLPLGEGGLRYGALADAVAVAAGGSAPDGAWLLVDGEAPATTRWSLGLITLFVGFAGFGAFGLVRLLGKQS